MNYKQIDLLNWCRYKQYEFFSEYDNPFFNICSTIDVTTLLKQCKKHQTPFSTAMLFVSIDTANKIKEFKYRIKNKGVVEYNEIYAGSTVLNDDETFSFCYFDYFSDFSEFKDAAKKTIHLHKTESLEFDGRNTDLDLIHYSVIPWISFSSFSHPRNYNKNDSIPKIVFGKYYEIEGRTLMPISIEVHHALMDGFHLGKYLDALQNKINEIDLIC
jgi:chloramphenicol O-acetyltransferase type A